MEQHRNGGLTGPFFVYTDMGASIRFDQLCKYFQRSLVDFMLISDIRKTHRRGA